VHEAVIDVRVDAETVHGTWPTLTRMSAKVVESFDPVTEREEPESEALEIAGVMFDEGVNPHKLASVQV
jgi:hypothetical protein